MKEHRHNIADRVLNRILRNCSPGWSWCYCCERPWRFTKGHSTPYDSTANGFSVSSCFPLCERCWKGLEDEHPALTASNRLPFYEKLANEWKSQGNTDPKLREKLDNAVYIEAGLGPLWNLNEPEPEAFISTGDLEMDGAINKWLNIL